MQLVRDESSKPIELVKKLLELKREIDHMVLWSFCSDADFQKCRDRAFQTFINESDINDD